MSWKWSQLHGQVSNDYWLKLIRKTQLWLKLVFKPKYRYPCTKNMWRLNYQTLGLLHRQCRERPILGLFNITFGCLAEMICDIFWVSRYICGCVYIYIIHRYSMYLWWVVNVRWGRFASLLLLCERNLHCGICSGILNPNRPQHAPTQNYLPLVETQYVWDEVKQCTSSNQRGNNTRIPQTVYDIVWSWNTCI